VRKFWTNNCKTIAVSGTRVGEHLREGEHIICNLESIDMWIKIKLFMVQGKYSIDANLDLKIVKAMVLKDFKNLMQKLALQMWNKCVPVFEAQRKKNIAKTSQIFKLQSSEGNTQLNSLTFIDLENIQQIFVLQSIKILGTAELNKKEVRKKHKEMSQFELRSLNSMEEEVMEVQTD